MAVAVGGITKALRRYAAVMVVPQQQQQQATPEWVVVLALIAVTLQLIRLSMELVQDVSESQQQAVGTTTGNTKEGSTISSLTETNNKTSASAPLKIASGVATNYGSVTEDEEQQPLMSPTEQRISRFAADNTKRNALLFTAWTVLFLIFVVVWLFGTTVFPDPLLLASAATLFLEDYLLFADPQRRHYGYFQRFLHMSAALALWCDYAILLLQYSNSSKAEWLDIVLMVAATLNVLLTVAEGWITAHYVAPAKEEEDGGKKTLSRAAIFTLVKPYVWPDATDCSAVRNRMLAIGTWVCVVASKVCGLVSPLFLGWASTALAHQDYSTCIRYSVLYSFITWLGSTFKEGQSLLYLKVAQAAFVQLSETAFSHLHSLSLDWHLRKKLGEVLRR